MLTSGGGAGGGSAGSLAEGVQSTELFMSRELDISLLRVCVLGTQSEVYRRISV